jgi:hypothetical protein
MSASPVAHPRNRKSLVGNADAGHVCKVEREDAPVIVDEVNELGCLQLGDAE